MKLLDTINRAIGFTPKEGKLAVFLVLTFIIGSGIRYYRSSLADQAAFDYAREDSIFAARSNMLMPGETSLTQGADSSDDAPVDPANSSASEQSNEVHVQDEWDESSKPPLPAPHSLDINAATREELMALPGVGEGMAQTIVQYRKQHGRFAHIDSLLNIRGIGAKKFERIAPYLKPVK